MKTELNKQETMFVVEGLVHLITQAEKQLLKFEKLKDESARDDFCNYQVRKIKSLRTLKAKLKLLK